MATKDGMAAKKAWTQLSLYIAEAGRRGAWVLAARSASFCGRLRGFQIFVEAQARRWCLIIAMVPINRMQR